MFAKVIIENLTVGVMVWLKPKSSIYFVLSAKAGGNEFDCVYCLIHLLHATLFYPKVLLPLSLGEGIAQARPGLL